VDEDFSFLQPLDLITKNVHELRQMVSEKRKKLQKERNKELEKEHEAERGRTREKERHQREKEVEKDRERERVKIAKEREHVNKTDREVVRDQDKVTAKHIDKEVVRDQDKVTVKHEVNGAVGGPEPMEICTTSTSQPRQIPSSDVTILEGHTSEVCACAWCPSGSLLASGSGDSTARIWSIPEGRCKPGSQSVPLDALVLKHVRGKTNEKSKDVQRPEGSGG
jgi:transducin (beta)-like 1